MIRYARVLALLLLAGVFSEARSQNPTLHLQLDGKAWQGTPLAWTNSSVTLLSRDGHLLQFSPDDMGSYRKVSDDFRSYTQSEMRGALQREFGRGYQVSGTGHYLVVHPAGEKDLWAPRFEKLYRSFAHYFTARGFRPAQPRFPMVAVVFRDRRQFDTYLRGVGHSVGANVLGFYSNTTNRIMLYDQTGGEEDPQLWHMNADTIIHEATHQTAFNTGIHSRYALPPRWVGEGLGMMFEARGVWNSTQYTGLGDRLNRYRLNDLKRSLENRPGGFLTEIVSSDRIFRSNAGQAYAEAWGLTFFLAETRHAAYMNYLKRTASRPAFTKYTSPERLQDFTDAFGTNLAVLEAHYLRYINSLD